jgi:hypothetical protein
MPEMLKPDISKPDISKPEVLKSVTRFNLSPLVRFTLLSLYLALTVPLPYLATATQAEIPSEWLWGAIVLGFIGLYGALCERVLVDETVIQVTYPVWFPFRKGWQLEWSKVKDLRARSTGQGGLVYYFVSDENGEEKGYLLPMRVAGFARLVNLVEKYTNIETKDVKPLSQPWMYLFLLVLTGFLALVDTWAIVAAKSM